jgi:hypothetical protein
MVFTSSAYQILFNYSTLFYFTTLAKLTMWRNYNYIRSRLAGCIRLCYDEQRIDIIRKSLGKIISYDFR